MGKKKGPDWKELGMLVSTIVSLFTIIRDTFKERGIGIEITPWLLDEGKERFVAALNNLGEEFKKFAADLAAKAEENTFFTPLSDEEAVETLVKAGKYDEATAAAIVAAWRKLANNHGYNGPIAQRVKAGFTLKEHASKVGPCYEKFGYLQDRKLKNDEPTRESLVFFVPRLVADSKNKNVEEQIALLSDLRQRFNLPAHHLASFGSAALLAGLILAHFKRIGERVPLNTDWTRTDTLFSDGVRLLLGDFAGSGLDCGDWLWADGSRRSSLGCFALGVEVLGS